ncbi:MAG TPA: hypothetical protein VFT32_08930 [Candidatus Eisenbacteria bacterium]|nr:hypothetical protein [Candidatus Eisenbacteria bacterium]
MRVARFSWVLLLLAVSPPAGIAPPRVFASSQQDSIPPPRPHVATIHLERGDSIRAAYAGPWSYDAVRYETVEGHVGYLSLHQIARVVDPSGSDVTTRTLRGRKPIGSLSGERPPSFGAWLGGLAVTPVKYRPNRHARAFTVVETAVLSRGGERGEPGAGAVYYVGLGGMKNLSRSWAIGGVAHVGGEYDDYRAVDVGARARYYLSDRLSIDATGGAFAAFGNNGDTSGFPVFVEAAVTFADAVSLVTRAERAHWRGHRYFLREWPFDFDIVETNRTSTVWRGGLRLGSSPKWLSVSVLLLGTLVFIQPGSDDVY